MKNWIYRICLFSGLNAASCLWLNANAQSQPATSAVVQTAPASEVVPAPKLPYGVEEIVKLSRAQVSEDVIVKYIQNSGTIYTLTPTELVYLRDQGVSDHVVHTMLDQRKNVSEAVAQQPAPTYAPAPAPTYVTPPPVDAQPAVTYPPASTVYVIPHPTTYSPYVYYGYPGAYYPSYGYYGGYWGPSFAFRFGYGGHYGHSHYHRH